ncbi:MAG: PVC-type heme-binding CxxCH protein, partial [Planctomycetota bacterium]
MRTRLVCVLMPLLCALPVSATAVQEAVSQEAVPQEQGPQRLTDRFLVPEGLEVTLWAASPLLFNPTAMDVDARGRVWVTEAVNYRRWGGRNPGREHAGGDRVVILEDTDGDGAADSSHVFVQDPDLTAPLGICVLGSRVFVSCSPNIFVYTDHDGDDVADSREVFLTGFGGFDHDHGVHSIVAGDDGWLYLAVGNAGPHLVTGADGFQLRSGSMYSGGTPYNQDNQPGLTSDDGRVWTGGLLLRVRPDGTGLRVVAHNFRNQYEVALDSFGNLYTADNDDDGNRSCRTTWVAEGGNYGYFSADGSRSWQADRRPGQETTLAHWHADDPGVMPPGTINGAGGPTGVCVYESEFTDGELALFDGCVLNCDAGAGMVYAHFPARRGAGLYLERSVFLGRGAESGREPGDGRAHWFRPSDVVVAPDGSVLVADWYDPGVGGHAMGDREAYGRILRVAAADAPAGREPLLYRLATPEEIEASDDVAGPYSHLLNALCSPAVSVRAAARELLIDGGQGAFDALHELAGDESPRIAARAVMVLARMGERGEAFCEQVTYHPAPQLRVAAYRALCAVDSALLPDIRRRLARDIAPWVRAAVARSIVDLEASQRIPLLTTLALLYEGDDRYYLESLGLGALGLEMELGAELRSLHERGAPDTNRYRDFMWRLHPDDATLEFATWAADENLPLETRRRALDALAFVPTREAADAAY